MGLYGKRLTSHCETHLVNAAEFQQLLLFQIYSP